MTKYKVLRNFGAYKEGQEVSPATPSGTVSFTNGMLAGAAVDTLLELGAIQEIPPTPATPRLKGMPAMERVEKYDFYHLINIDGSASRYWDRLPYFDGEIFEVGNYYSTREAAEEAAAWYRARTNLIRAAHRISGGTNGWIKGYGPNYYPVFLNDGSGITFLWQEYTHLMCESFMYLRTESQARQFAEECKDDLMVYFGI